MRVGQADDSACPESSVAAESKCGGPSTALRSGRDDGGWKLTGPGPDDVDWKLSGSAWNDGGWGVEAYMSFLVSM